MDKYTYNSLIQTGTPRKIIRAILKCFNIDITFKILDSKIMARMATPPPPRPAKHPSFVMKTQFFAVLDCMQSVEMEVTESRSHIRKNYYGFRDGLTGERVYLKKDGDSIVMIRDSVAGFIFGRRYYIPGIERLSGKYIWNKVFTKMNIHIEKLGIVIDERERKYYYSRIALRWKTADMLYARRLFYIKRKILKCISVNFVDIRKRSLSEKTWR